MFGDKDASNTSRPGGSMLMGNDKFRIGPSINSEFCPNGTSYGLNARVGHDHDFGVSYNPNKDSYSAGYQGRICNILWGR